MKKRNLYYESNPPDRSRVMITGAAGGLGSAFARECAARGWDLVLVDVRGEALEALAGEIRAGHAVTVIPHACDLTDADARTRLFERCRKEGLTFGMLLNVAGVDHEGAFLSQSRQRIQHIIRLNIEATSDLSHEMVRFREPTRAFRIVTVSSLAAFYPMPVKATYAASKRFLLDFFTALREEIREAGATVTILCPAGLPTTPEIIRSIASQGWVGRLTTCGVRSVAAQTIEAALKGRALVIPGRVNRLLRFLGGLVPGSWVARLIRWRWERTRARKEGAGAAPLANPSMPSITPG